MIKLLKKKIVLLEISPLGGILHIDKCQNDYNYKEFLIYISGPLASLGLLLSLNYLNANEILRQSALYVLILNLLPIHPLDGAKILMSLKQYIMPFRKVLKFITTFSVGICLLLIIYFINNYNYVIILSFFIYLNLIKYKNISYEYYEFLCYKHFHHNRNLKNKISIANKKIYNLFYKGYHNIFFINNQFSDEEEVLRNIIIKK